MSTENVSPEVAANLPRAGFWRRLTAILIDAFLVLLPVQVLAVILFATTAGTVQMYSGVTFKYCDKAVVPQGLIPPPPHDSNFAQICRVSFFGATTGVVLTVARVTTEGSVTKTVDQSYMVNTDGDPINGLSIDWIALLAIFIYLVSMIWKTGRTIGARIVGIRFINVSAPDKPGVPIGKVALRYLAMWIGSVPAFAFWTYRKMTTDGSADAMFAGSFFEWFIGPALIGVAWYIWLVVQVARKKDPAYDRLAGTAAVRGRSL
jgi:hypothetical protein